RRRAGARGFRAASGLMSPQRLDTPRASTATIWPITFAVGVAVALIGLIVNPEVIAPLGGVITVLPGIGWVRGSRGGQQPTRAEESRPAAPSPHGQRYSRSRYLARATLGLGGLAAAAVTFPAAGPAR